MAFPALAPGSLKNGKKEEKDGLVEAIFTTNLDIAPCTSVVEDLTAQKRQTQGPTTILLLCIIVSNP